MFVKICGICSERDALEAAERGADALGFIFWRGSKRFVEAADVAAWTERLPAGILKAGVFVDAQPDEIAQTVRIAGLDVVQLHGELECPALDVKVWRVRYADRPAETIPAKVDAYILDSYSESSPGGTGLCGDWDAAAKFVQESRMPVILAGGLRPDNVAGAIAKVRPWGVDVSSGVESAPRIKDLKKIKEFIANAKRAG
ncbi:MAG: N-(5'-phosphoribosyl)anthranilate isomerase [Kiritimatiellia bacterium]